MTASKKTQRSREQQWREIQYAEAELDRTIATSFSMSYMSDSKWRRLFDAATDQSVDRCRWKFVGDDRSWITRAPESQDLEHGYFENIYGYFRLKHVEWIELLTEDTQSLKTALKSVGHFEIEEGESGLRVYGYR